MGSMTRQRRRRQTMRSCARGPPDAWRVRRCWCRSPAGHRRDTGSTRSSGSGHNASPAPAWSGRRHGRFARSARRASPRPAAGCAAVAPPGGPRPVCRGCQPRWHRVRRCAAALPPPAAIGWRRGCRRTCAAHAPSRRQAAGYRPLCREPTRRTRHSHRPAADRGTPADASAGARLCGLHYKRRQRLDGPGRATADCPPRSTTAVRSWCVRAPGRAPAAWCHRRTLWANSVPCSAPVGAAAPATSRRGPPSCTAWNGPA